MTRDHGIEALRGIGPAPAFGLTWVPSDALQAMAAQPKEADPAEMLASVATALALDLVFVPAGEPWGLDAVRLLRQANIAAVWSVSGVLGRAAERQGWAEVISRSATEPGALAFMLSDVLHDALDDVRRGRFLGVDAVCIADDVASDAGWLVSPDFALEALVPCYRQLAAETDSPAIFHSDGDVRLLFPALRIAGFSAVHVAVSGRSNIERCFGAARAAGLVPMGGIEARDMVGNGASETGRFARGLGTRAAVVLCDDGGISSADEIAAFTTAIEAARDMGAG